MDISLTVVQNVLSWIKTKLFLIKIEPNAKNRTVKRGQVYSCNFGVGIGSEMQKERPCVIVQNDIANLKSPNTIVVPITHDTSTLPCMAPITEKHDPNGNKILDGQANTSNVICVSKARLGNYICDLSNDDLKNVERALARSIDLIQHYSSLEHKLEDKLKYIERIKNERNTAQDKLIQIKSICEGIDDKQTNSILDIINS